jgi:hypothetical protein
MKRDFEYLRKHYGSHTAVAKELGISQRAYRYYRNGDTMPRSITLLVGDRVKLLRLTQLKI